MFDKFLWTIFNFYFHPWKVVSLPVALDNTYKYNSWIVFFLLHESKKCVVHFQKCKSLQIWRAQILNVENLGPIFPFVYFNFTPHYRIWSCRWVDQVCFVKWVSCKRIMSPSFLVLLVRDVGAWPVVPVVLLELLLLLTSLFLFVTNQPETLFKLKKEKI